MKTQTYRLVYCSRNRIEGSPEQVTEELRTILETSRRNNAAAGVTGALLYNSGTFAQVLEGPVEAVGPIFEKIQRDLRHSEVTVVESGYVGEKDFPDWSMAFAGNSAEPLPAAQAAFTSAFGNMAGASEQLMQVLRELVVQEDDWILMDAA